MTLYNKQRLINLLIYEQVKKWFGNDWITADQAAHIMSARINAYKRAHVLYRIGIFILTSIIIFSTGGLAGLISGSFDGETSLRFYLLICTGVVFFLLQFFIREKGHFKTGVDDALLYNGLMLLVAVIQLFFNHADDDFMLFFVCSSLPFFILAAILFVDRLLAVLAMAGIAALVFLVALKTGDIGKLLLPFLLMATAAVFFFLLRGMIKNNKLFLWHDCMHHAQLVSLILFYVAGNYYVVREAGAMLMGISVMPGEDIPFAYFFYLLTAVIPLFYIYAGIKTKSYSLLNTGLLFIALSILTFRYYYHVLEIEVAMIAGGALLMALSFFSLRYFKTVRFGITEERDREKNNSFNLAAEALVIAQTFSKAPAQADKGTPFGGGEFGGGGAGSNY